jgi:ComF family protein
VKTKDRFNRVLQYVERKRGCQPGFRAKVDSLFDVIMPHHCVVCGLSAPPPGICPGCRAGLPWCGVACRVCGLPLTETESAICGTCQRTPPPWDTAVAATWYRFPVRQLVRQFKFQRNLAAGRVLADLLARKLERARCPAPDLVVPVPLHRWRLLRRGFNQAYDIARQLCRDFDLQLVDHDLWRKRRTPHQAGLDAKQRRRNLHGAFAWRGTSVAGQHVALVDDVMTTGSTAGECARTLRRAGANEIQVWVMARAEKP